MTKNKKEKLTRKHKISITLNDKEYTVLNNYIKKYKINNTAQLIRQFLFKSILEQFDKDYPSLFADQNNEDE